LQQKEMSMATLRRWFESFEKETGEIPSSIVFGSDPWAYLEEEMEQFPEGWREVLELARFEPGKVGPFDALTDEVLDQEFNGGYGRPNTPNLCAWSRSWVIGSAQYDGSESLYWLPRFPLDHLPVRPGG
jgi:hypothetical protein